MKSCRVNQPITAVPAAIVGAWNHTGRRVRLVLLPRLDLGAAFFQGRKGWVRWDLDGSRHDLEPGQARAQLAELEAGAKDQAAAQGPEVLRGRWSCSAGIRDGALVVELTRTIAYVSTVIRFEGGGWKIQPFKRRPTWFSAGEDWPQTATAAPNLREAIATALDQARAGITLACTRRDSTRREAPAPPAPRKPRAQKPPAAEAERKATTGSQRRLF